MNLSACAIKEFSLCLLTSIWCSPNLINRVLEFIQHTAFSMTSWARGLLKGTCVWVHTCVLEMVKSIYFKCGNSVIIIWRIILARAQNLIPLNPCNSNPASNLFVLLPKFEFIQTLEIFHHFEFVWILAESSWQLKCRWSSLRIAFHISALTPKSPVPW